MLDSCSSLNGGASTFDAAALSAHPAWKREPTDDARRAAFERWVEKKAEEDRRARKRAFLDYLEGCQWITSETTWKDAVDRVEARVPEFEMLSKFDRVDVFDNFMTKMEDRERSANSVREEIRQRKESQGRIALRKIFLEHLRTGAIHAKLTWKEYLTSQEGGEASEAIRSVESNTSGSRPRDLFMDVIEEAEDLYERERPLVAASRSENEDSDVNELRKLLKNSVSESSIRLFVLEEASKRGEGADEEADRKRRRT